MDSKSAVSPHTAPTTYYPAFLNLRGKKVVVVGGGRVAERKILALLRAGADVTVVSPVIADKLEKEKTERNLRHIRRRYRKGDLDNAFLVIAATNSVITNERVSRDAPFLVNVVDTPKLCNFFVPSTVNRGHLTIAISTGGVSPALSKSIRKELEKELGPEIARYLTVLRKMRAEALRTISDNKKRGRFLKAIASDKMLRLLRESGLEEAKRRVYDLFRKAEIG